MARIAYSLAKLRDQVNAAAPKRSKAADGWIGDSAHSKRKSEHNPNAAGVVRALDITHDPKNGLDSYALAESLRQSQDRRIDYVISNGRIFSKTTSPWRWRKYTGANKHSVHVHISVSSHPAEYDNRSPWDIGIRARPEKPAPEISPQPEEPDDTKPHEADSDAPKTGISEGAKVGVGAGVLGVASQGWDAVSTAPDSILQVIIAAMSKPQFWIFAVVIAAGVYVWWRRRNMKKATA